MGHRGGWGAGAGPRWGRGGGYGRGWGRGGQGWRRGGVQTAAGAQVLSTEVVPRGGVLISGPQSLVGDLQLLVTSPVSLDGHALDFEQRAQVVSPDAKIQIVDPAVVTVRVALEIPTVGASR